MRDIEIVFQERGYCRILLLVFDEGDEYGDFLVILSNLNVVKSLRKRF